MNQEQLAHVLRAAAKIAGDPGILVIGSQAILGSFDDPELPVEATRSVEADLVFFDDPVTTRLTRSTARSARSRRSIRPTATTAKECH